MSSANRTPRAAGGTARRRLDLALRRIPGASLAAVGGASLVGLASDEDPELGLVGVVFLRQAAEVCEEHQVLRARATGWTWAQIASVLEVSPQAVLKKHAARVGDLRGREKR